MSKSDTKIKIWKIPMPIGQDYQVITSHIIDKHKKEVIIMTYLTEDDEKLLDDAKEITLKRGNLSFTVSPKNVICYGSIDFSDDSEDLDFIENMKFLNHLGMRGIDVPSDYDYNTHCVISNTKNYKHFDTTNPAIVTQYKHGCLGKPKITVIFKKQEYVKTNNKGL